MSNINNEVLDMGKGWESIDLIEMINGWCNDFVAGLEGVDPLTIIMQIQTTTQDHLDEQNGE